MKVNILGWFNAEISDSNFNKEENCICFEISDIAPVKTSVELGFYDAKDYDCPPVIFVTGNKERVEFEFVNRKIKEGDVLEWNYSGTTSKGMKIDMTIFND